MTGEERPRRSRKLTREDKDLWRGVARALKPLRQGAKPLPPDEPELKPAPPPERRETPGPAVPAAIKTARPAAAALPVQAAALARKERRHIARGKVSLDGRLDLHGFTAAQAHGALLQFLRISQQEGRRLVLVITGKGSRSGEPGVLRRQVPLWFAQPEFRLLVSQYDTAEAAHGGDGALYVRLRRLR